MSPRAQRTSGPSVPPEAVSATGSAPRGRRRGMRSPRLSSRWAASPPGGISSSRSRGRARIVSRRARCSDSRSADVAPPLGRESESTANQFEPLRGKPREHHPRYACGPRTSSRRHESRARRSSGGRAAGARRLDRRRPRIEPLRFGPCHALPRSSRRGSGSARRSRERAGDGGCRSVSGSWVPRGAHHSVVSPILAGDASPAGVGPLRGNLTGLLRRPVLETV